MAVRLLLWIEEASFIRCQTAALFMEEIGSRATIFELEGLGTEKRKYLKWVLTQRNVVLRDHSFSLNLVPKPRMFWSGPFMFSVRYI